MTPEQTGLIVKAHKSLRAAKLLASNSLSDFAASRAYYTMFYVAEAFLIGSGLAFSSHAAVISAFGREFAKPGRVPAKFHRYLMDAQDRRNQADYDIDPGITKAQAEEQISRAVEFIELAENSIGSLSPNEE